MSRRTSVGAAVLLGVAEGAGVESWTLTGNSVVVGGGTLSPALVIAESA
ncbi:hypothetical protein [Variovorax sp. HW608]|nr:hypothetical protein [Variovorax sp. HW608]